MATDTLAPPLARATSRSEVLTRATRVVVAVAALVPIGVYLYVALRQLRFAYELEWLEGGSVEIVQRVLHGQNIYVAPSLHYVPYPYTPLYFWVSAGMAHLVGIGFLPLRLVSFLASIGCFAVLFAIVRRETGDWVAGLVSAGLFAATFEVSTAWFDLARVDSLYLLFLLLSVAAARQAQGWRGGLVLGLLAFLAFFTKQSALLALAPLLVLLVVTRRRVGVPALATTAGLVVLSTLLLNAQSHHWYGYYVFGELSHQGIDHSVWYSFVPHDLLRRMGWAITLGVVGLAVGWWSQRTSKAWLLWLSVLAGFIGSALVARLHSGGGPDVLMPAYAAIALLAGLGYDSLRRRSDVHRVLVNAALAFMVAAQVFALRDHPLHLIPSAQSAAAGRQFIAAVAHTRGDVIIFDHPWYETMAGKPSWAQAEAVHDVLRAGPSRARTDLMASIRSELANPTITTIYADNPGDTIGPGFSRYFTLVLPGSPPVFSCSRCFFPVTDYATRPYLRYVRR